MCTIFKSDDGDVGARISLDQRDPFRDRPETTREQQCTPQRRRDNNNTTIRLPLR